MHFDRDSRAIVRRLQQEGWTLRRVTGSHHHFRKAGVAFIITVPHPKRDLPLGTVRAIYRQAGWIQEVNVRPYIGIVAKDPDSAYGVSFPDAPGCFAAADDIDELFSNAQEALSGWLAAMKAEGLAIPPARDLSTLRGDMRVAPELADAAMVICIEPKALGDVHEAA